MKNKLILAFVACLFPLFAHAAQSEVELLCGFAGAVAGDAAIAAQQGKTVNEFMADEDAQFKGQLSPREKSIARLVSTQMIRIQQNTTKAFVPAEVTAYVEKDCNAGPWHYGVEEEPQSARADPSEGCSYAASTATIIARARLGGTDYQSLVSLYLRTMTERGESVSPIVVETAKWVYGRPMMPIQNYAPTVQNACQQDPHQFSVP